MLPKHWWEGTDKDGKQRNIGETTLEPPLGSGPYRIKEFSAGRNIVYERVKDYWAKDLNVNVGSGNFDELHYEYFRDATVAIESFKSAHVDWREENSAKSWATAYDFPAVHEKRVLLEEFPISNFGIMQAFVFNLAARKIQGRARPACLQLRLQFRGDEQADFLRAVQPHRQLLPGHRTRLQRVPTGKELELLNTVTTRCRPNCSRSPIQPAQRQPPRGAQ